MPKTAVSGRLFRYRQKSAGLWRIPSNSPVTDTVARLMDGVDKEAVYAHVAVRLLKKPVV